MTPPDEGDYLTDETMDQLDRYRIATVYPSPDHNLWYWDCDRCLTASAGGQTMHQAILMAGLHNAEHHS